jgi:DNA invertase Pin-like site-specific DNA recombinase
LFPIFAIIGLKVPFLALDRPGLTRTALIRDLRESGVIVRDPLDSVTKTQGYRLVAREARREPKEKEQSDRIKKGMRESEQRGVKLGNPIIAEVQRRAVWMNQMKQPSHATLSLIRKLRNDGKSLREIAKILNDHNIATPQNKRWYASSVKNYLVS